VDKGWLVAGLLKMSGFKFVVDNRLFDITVLSSLLEIREIILKVKLEIKN